MAGNESDDACCFTLIHEDDLDNLDNFTGEFQIDNWSEVIAGNDEVASNLSVGVSSRGDNIPTESISMEDAVFLEFPKFFKVFQKSDFCEFIQKYVGEENLLRLENWEKPNLWIMKVKNKEIRENLLRMWKTKIKNKTCYINPYYAHELRGLIHWLPHFITDEEIKIQLNLFGDVVILENVVHDHWKAKVQSEVIYFGLRLKDGMVKNDMPHFLEFGDYRALIHIRGRRPECFHCRKYGHSKKDCKIYKEMMAAYCKNRKVGKPRIKPRGRRHRPQQEEEIESMDNKQQDKTKSASTSMIRSTMGPEYIAENASQDNKNQEKNKSALTSMTSLTMDPECIAENASQDNKQQDKTKSASTSMIRSTMVPECIAENASQDNKQKYKIDSTSSGIFPSQRGLEALLGQELTVVNHYTEILSILQSLKEWEKKTVEMVELTLEGMETEVMNSAVTEIREKFPECLIETMVKASFQEMKRITIKLITDTSIYLKKFAAKHFGLDKNEPLEKLANTFETSEVL